MRKLRGIDFRVKQFAIRLRRPCGYLLLKCGYVQVRIIAKLRKQSTAGLFPESSQQTLSLQL